MELPVVVVDSLVDELIACDGCKRQTTMLKEENKAWQEKDSLKNLTILKQDTVIVKYKADSVSYNRTIESKDKGIKEAEDEGDKRAIKNFGWGTLVGIGLTLLAIIIL